MVSLVVPATLHKSPLEAEINFYSKSLSEARVTAGKFSMMAAILLHYVIDDPLPALLVMQVLLIQVLTSFFLALNVFLCSTCLVLFFTCS